MKLLKYIIPIFICSYSVGTAQPIVGVSAYWNDSYTEWTILSEEEKDDGKIQMMWELRNDWTDWEFDFGNQRGRIEQLRDNDRSRWTLTSGGDRLEMQTVWPGDFTEWKIRHEDIKLVIKTRISNIGDEWIIDHPDHGQLFIYTEWQGDPRDWIIEDYLSEQVSTLAKIAAIHIVLMQSTRR